MLIILNLMSVLDVNFRYSSSHVAARLPYHKQNGTKLGMHFFETLYSYEVKMSTKKIYHRWTSELTVGMDSQ